MQLLIGSAKDGSVRYATNLTLAEGVAVDSSGAIYVGETVPGHVGDMLTGHMVRKLVKN